VDLWDDLGSKKSLEVICLKPVPRMVAEMGLQGLAHSTSVCLWGWRSYSLSGQPFPVFDYHHGENVFFF